MVKPTHTAHALRALFKDLNYNVNVDANGMVEDIPFPNTKSNPDFAREYMLHHVAKKREPKKGSYDAIPAMRNSLLKWANSEHTCRVVNQHGRYYSPIGEDASTFSLLECKVKSHISRILCEYWPDLESLDFTGGATSGARRLFCHPAAKASGMPDILQQTSHNLACVKGAQDLLEELLESNPGYARRLEQRRWKLIEQPTSWSTSSLADWLCQGNVPARMDFVPKNTKEVRLICKTGGMTANIQKMFGACIRSALLKEGINLNDQTINQEWAEIGSLTGLIATVDLSSASDNIALGLLRLLPPRWQEYVLATRDTFVSAGGSEHKLEKIAGMGNGFIFELESLLFYAMALAVCDHLNLNTSWVSVYGDDIIIPSAGTSLLERYFNHYGFTYNSDKSFSDLNGFRESCGKHYYKGEDVTPFYIRGDAETISDHYHYVNGLVSWSNRTKVKLPSVIALLVKSIPTKERYLVPLSYPSRSGLHWPVEGAIAPREVYDRNLQRYTIVFKTINAEGNDYLDRYPDDVNLTARLLVLEAPKVVFSNEMLSDVRNMHRSLFLWRYSPLYEYQNCMISHDVIEKRRTNRI